jgi:hypothetical protein
MLSLALIVAALISAPATELAAKAKGTLPQPYVSRSLDLVLLPVTDAVRREFKLGKKAAGAVVASVEPGGTGEFYGIEPGDVISQVDGKTIRRPVDIDSMVRYGLKKDDSFFQLDGTRKNKRIRTWVVLSQQDYEKPVALDKVKAWRGYGGRGQRRGAGYFYYPDYCDVYYDDFYSVWDYSYTYIEEIIVTEVYITSYESTETVFYYDETAIGYDWPDDDYISEVDSYVYSEEFTAEYNSTEVVYEDDASTSDQTGDALGTSADGYIEPVADEAAYEEPVSDEPAYEETATEEPVYDEAVTEEPAYEETVAEEPVYEEPAYEEPAPEEPVYEEPVYEEPVYEEPAYEEPVYEEPAYEEPASDGGGSSCYYDDEGNEVCG